MRSLLPAADRPRTVRSIDPGVPGAVASWLDGVLVDVFRVRQVNRDESRWVHDRRRRAALPVTPDGVVWPSFHDAWRAALKGADAVIIEDGYVGKHALPALKAGVTRGRILESARWCGVPHERVLLVQPAVWRAALKTASGVAIPASSAGRERIKAAVTRLCDVLGRARPGSGIGALTGVADLSIDEQEAVLLGLAEMLRRGWK